MFDVNDIISLLFASELFQLCNYNQMYETVVWGLYSIIMSVACV